MSTDSLLPAPQRSQRERVTRQFSFHGMISYGLGAPACCTMVYAPAVTAQRDGRWFCLASDCLVEAGDLVRHLAGIFPLTAPRWREKDVARYLVPTAVVWQGQLLQDQERQER